jgi:menaquinone-9 beta-reductase
MAVDVIVVGAGPAGIATAIAAALNGLQVSVLDFRKPPIDKPCGEGLLPEAVAALRRLGVCVDQGDGFYFRGIRFCDAESTASARIRGEAYGLRRTTLHRLLAERAERLGVRFYWGARVSDFHADHVKTAGERISFRWLIGADGQNSAVRRWAGLNPRQRFHSRFGFRRHYVVKAWSDCVEVHWGERCQMFVTPTGVEEVCIAVLSDNPRMRIERALEQFPEVAERLRGASVITQEAGAVSVLGCARAVARGNVALVGDASCAIDGIAGEGLSLAFQEAEVLGAALAGGDLGCYEVAHSEITRVALRMTRLLLLMNSSSWLRRKVLRLFTSKPPLFARMMALHTRESAVRELKPSELAGLGWRILWA